LLILINAAAEVRWTAPSTPVQPATALPFSLPYFASTAAAEVALALAAGAAIVVIVAAFNGPLYTSFMAWLFT